MLRRMAAVLVLATLLTSCVGGGYPSGSASPSGGFSPSGGPSPSGGLTQAEAHAAAMAALPDATGVVSAKVGRMRDFDTGSRSGRAPSGMGGGRLRDIPILMRARARAESDARPLSAARQDADGPPRLLDGQVPEAFGQSGS